MLKFNTGKVVKLTVSLKDVGTDLGTDSVPSSFSETVTTDDGS